MGLQGNYTIAVIVISLFVVLAILGYVIYAIQNRVSLFSRGEKDLEDGASGTEE